eukprot:CAMPEP_0113457632 /NCGR_PEP_ID=MMETSP0014_2-20120614/9509_1 /TAXON_ID=2857 /ORGANISM="Nitzschia sp." /LENGTH=450 /DNA_ID=CAMNT_0000349135 /DNA_START=327 /DNA_END=1679 /DNA_ORIENTATION=- /assembly_acc=CAM_ASM_000159
MISTNTTKATTILATAAAAAAAAATLLLLFTTAASFSSATEAAVSATEQQQGSSLRGGRRRHHHHRRRRHHRRTQQQTDNDNNEFTEINFTYTYRESSTNAASQQEEEQYDVVCLVPDKCQKQTTPEDSERCCPLYVWIDGTDVGIFDGRPVVGTDDLDRTFLQEMAKRGYVACNPHYDDTLIGYIDGCGETAADDGQGLISGSGFVGKSRAIFDPTLPDSVVSQVCGTYAVCNNNSSTTQRGNSTTQQNNRNQIVVHGFSQGAHIAQLASYWNSNISKALLFGNGNAAGTVIGGFANNIDIELPCMMDPTYNPLDRTLRRYIAGENDVIFSPAELQTAELSGYDVETECTNRFECLQVDDGSGFYIVPDRGHSFFVQVGQRLYSTFVDDSTVWGLKQNFDWLAAAAVTSSGSSSTTTTTTESSSPSSSSSPMSSSSSPSSSPSDGSSAP